LARLAAYISSLEVFQIQLRKGYGIPDLKVIRDKRLGKVFQRISSFFQ
jgi:hypothetical protein